MSYNAYQSQTVGRKWFEITGNTAKFPSDGKGGATATASSSDAYQQTHIVFEGFAVTTFNTGETLTIVDDAGATIMGPISIPGSGAFHNYELDLLNVGAGGIGAKMSGSTAVVQVAYRIINPSS